MYVGNAGDGPLRRLQQLISAHDAVNRRWFHRMAACGVHAAPAPFMEGEIRGADTA